MCLQLARGLPPAPSRGRGREGPRAGARVPKRPWRGRGEGRASPKLPPRLRTGGELRWPPREDWTRAPAAFVRFLSVRSLLPPRLSGLAAAQGTETLFQSGRPLGAEGEVDPVGFGGEGGFASSGSAFPLARAPPPAEAQAPGSGSRPWAPAAPRTKAVGRNRPLKINMLSVCHLVRSVWGKESI